MLDVPEGQSLVKVEILNPTFNKKNLKNKESILDIRARVVGYGYINVEIQLSNQKNIHKRSLFYASRLYEGQLGEKGKYKTLTKVVAINLIDFNYFQSEDYHRCFGLKEDGTLEPYPDDLMKLYFIEMPKFRALERNGKIAPNDRLAKWLRFLTNTDDTRWEEMAKQDPMLELGIEKLRVASMDPEIRMQYEAREKALRDIESIRDDALDEGIEKGIKKGRQEEKREMAQNLLREGVDIEIIMRASGLTKEEIEKIATELNN